jgi:hypothetical protein
MILKSIGVLICVLLNVVVAQEEGESSNVIM